MVPVTASTPVLALYVALTTTADAFDTVIALVASAIFPPVITLSQSSAAARLYVVPSIADAPFWSSSASTAAISAPASVTEKLVASMISTLLVVDSVRVAPP